MKTTRFLRLGSLLSRRPQPARRHDTPRRTAQRRLRSVERLEDRAILSVTSPYPDMVPTVGVYDENDLQPNTVDVTAAGSSMTAAEFADRVASAWQGNAGGVIDGSALVSVYGFGQDLNKFLHMQPTNRLGGSEASIAVGTPASPLSISGSGAFSTTDSMYSQAMVLIGVESAEPNEHIVEFGLTVLGVNDTDFGTVHVLAHAYSGNDMHLTHQVGGPGSQDVFFGFEAAPADYFGAFTIAYQTDDGMADKPLWFDDIAFITGDPFAGVNSPPIANDDAYSLDQDTTLTVSAPGVLANDSDPDGDPLTAAAGTTRHGSLNFNPDGSFSYTPDPGYVGTDSFTYQALDGTSFAQATVTLTINEANPPTAQADAYSLTEDSILSIAGPGVLSNDSDADGDPLSAALVQGPAHGTLAFSADGSFNYTPDSNYFGADSFTYVATDGTLNSNVATVTLSIANVNDAPLAMDDAYTAAEDTMLTVAAPGLLGNDTDVEGDALAASLVSGPSHGTLVLEPDGSFTYTPAANYDGADSFTYVASDGTADSNIATVTLNVTGVNDVPLAENDSYSLSEDTPLVVTAPGLLSNDSDPDGDPLVARVRSWPSHGTLDLNEDGSFRYTPSANYHGTDSFSYAVRDGAAESNIATVFLEIASVEDTPAAQEDAYTVAEDATLVIPAEVPTRLTMVSETGDFVGQGQTYDLNPSTGNFTVSRNFDNGVSIRYSSHADPGGFWHLDFAAPGEAELTAGVYTGATRYPFQAAEAPGLAVFGEGRGCNTLTGEFTVHEVVYGPAGDVLIFDASFEQHCEGATPALFGSMLYVSPTLAGVLTNDSDGDGDPLTAMLVSGPASGTLTLRADGSFNYIPNPDFYGTDSFAYRADDGTDLSEETTVAITVSPVNDVPVASPQTAATDEDTPLAGSVTATDADGHPLSFAIDQGPAHGALDLNLDGTFTYTPAADFHGTDSFSFTASDGTETSAASTFAITVSPINDAPVAAGQSITTEEDTPLAGAVVVGDVDGDSLSFVLLEAPANGTLSFNPDGTFTYTPSADFHGSDSFLFTATDGTSSSNVAAVEITVAPVHDAPHIADASFSIPENSPVGTTVGGVTADDVDGDSLTYSIIAGNAAGAFAIDPATGLVTVADATPLDYETTPQFVLTVQAADPGGLTATAAVTISLTDVVEILPIAIDILPGDSTNTISDKGNGRVDVAILSSTSFDALNVNLETLRFGRTGTEDSVSRTPQGSIRYHITDVNGDGLLDLVVEFDRDRMHFHADDTEGVLTGETIDGDLFAGQDAVTLVGNTWPA